MLKLPASSRRQVRHHYSHSNHHHGHHSHDNHHHGHHSHDNHHHGHHSNYHHSHHGHNHVIGSSSVGCTSVGQIIRDSTASGAFYQCIWGGSSTSIVGVRQICPFGSCVLTTFTGASYPCTGTVTINGACVSVGKCTLSK